MFSVILVSSSPYRHYYFVGINEILIFCCPGYWVLEPVYKVFMWLVLDLIINSRTYVSVAVELKPTGFCLHLLVVPAFLPNFTP